MGPAKRTSTVTPDIKKNRLYISVSGEASKKEIQKIYTDIRFCVPDLQAGFDVITDLSHCKVGHLSGISTFKQIMGYLIAHEVGRVVRVVGPAKLIFRQLNRYVASGKDYKPIYVSTQEEAEQKLAKSP